MSSPGTPTLSQYANGQGTLSGAQLNTFIQSCDNLAQLRTFIGLSNIMVYIRGAVTLGDGGQGIYAWNSTSTAADNGTTVIAPAGALVGRWILDNPGSGGGGGGPPSGPAGGDLTGTYPNPTIAASAVTTAKIATAAVTAATIAANAVGTTQIAAQAVTNAKLAPMVAHTYKGNNSGATGQPTDVSASALATDIGAIALTTIGFPQQGVLFSLTGGAWSSIQAFGGVTGSRTGTGQVSIVLSATALNMGYYVGGGGNNSGTGDSVGIAGPNVTLVAGNTYTFSLINVSNRTVFDPDRVMLLFY